MKNENNSTLCVMNYFKIRNRTTQFESVTGLKLEEFDKLLPVFTEEWRNFYRIHTIEGKKRKSPILNPLKGTKSLPSVAEKLFFILVYLKNYSLQEILGASFDVSQSQASKWQKVLTLLLNMPLVVSNVVELSKINADTFVSNSETRSSIFVLASIILEEQALSKI